MIMSKSGAKSKTGSFIKVRKRNHKMSWSGHGSFSRLNWEHIGSSNNGDDGISNRLLKKWYEDINHIILSVYLPKSGISYKEKQEVICTVLNQEN